MSAAEDFEEFVTILDAGSLTAAAQRLGIPRPTLSRRLARLESRLGVRLIHRTTRRIAATQEGTELYAKARLIVRAAQDAEAAVRRIDGVPRGLLRVSVPSEMPHAAMASWVAEFLETYPQVRMELVASAGPMDLIGGEFDIALRLGPVDAPNLVVRTLARDLQVAVVAPAYLAAGGPIQLADLQERSCIRGFMPDGTPESTWPLLDGGRAQVGGRLVSNQMGQRLYMARAGLGVALVVDRLVRQDLADGTLVPVLPGLLGRREPLCLCYPERSFMAPKTRAFSEFMNAKIQGIRQAKP